MALGVIDALSGAIERLLSDPLLRQRLGIAARATVEAHFSLESTIERLIRLYGSFGIEALPAHVANAARPTATTRGA